MRRGPLEAGASRACARAAASAPRRRPAVPQARSLRKALHKLHLEEVVKELLSVLLAVDNVDAIELQGLYDEHVCQEALRRYETIWLPLLERATGSSSASQLVPPIDVLWVSIAHRLAPAAYRTDCLARFGRVLHYSATPAGAAAPALPRLFKSDSAFARWAGAFFGGVVGGEVVVGRRKECVCVR